MDPVKLKVKWKFAVDLMNKHYKPPYLITHNLSKEYGPLMNLKFGVNNSSKFKKYKHKSSYPF